MDVYINAFARDCSFKRFEHTFVLSATLKSQRLSSLSFHSINQSINQSTYQPINQSIKRKAINQSINQEKSTQEKMLIQNTYAFLLSKIAEFQHEEERLDSWAISNYSNNQKLHNDHHIGIY